MRIGSKERVLRWFSKVFYLLRERAMGLVCLCIIISVTMVRWDSLNDNVTNDDDSSSFSLSQVL